jgi:FkbH-like protein
MRFPDLDWLPRNPAWIDDFKAATSQGKPTIEALQKLANQSLDFLKTNRFGHYLERTFEGPPEGLSARPVRLALLGSSTLDYLQPAIRVAALRRFAWIETFAGEYNLYRQELEAPTEALRRFAPDMVLLAIHAEELLGSGADVGLSAEAAEARVEAAVAALRRAWRDARRNLGARVIQQIFLPTAPAVAGSNEHRLPGSPQRLVAALNARLREAAEEDEVDLLALDEAVRIDGLYAWHDPALWHRAKQQISPAAAPMYGELVARIVAARIGRTAKGLVLDLDNTLWGGVIGDDGLEGILLGEGDAGGEAFGAFQRYAKSLSQRGIILAICSKNDEANAWLPFDEHPEMVLKRSDIACLVANWEDKPANLRRIATTLNIGLDSLVFADDNPFERELVRRELPMVAVPELPDDPALYAATLARAGYFEAVAITDDDLRRSGLYQENRQRQELLESTTDLGSYLRSLAMELRWSPFTRVDLKRVTQLINKSNQFNLTTRRLSEEEVAGAAGDPDCLTLQLRLVDRLGDNGIIAVVVARQAPASAEMHIELWLMSCRVLGRQVEAATLNLLADLAGRRGAKRLVGTYIPTAKNGMVRDHYRRLGFAESGSDASGATTWTLELDGFAPIATEIELKEAAAGRTAALSEA